MLRQVEFHIFLFCLLFVLIDWPFLAIPANDGLTSIFGYLFLLWASFIFLLFLIQRRLQSKASGDDGDDDGGSACSPRA